jgi:hypothetical protein
MNVVYIHGGLGNQLFQYAFGLVQQKHGVEVAYDRSWFDQFANITFREFHLDKFGIQLNYSKFLEQPTIKETDYGYMMRLFDFRNVNFYGYWQYFSYYNEVISELRDKVKLIDGYYTDNYNSIKEQIKGNTSIHVRRGDYLTTGGFLTVPIEYYKKAVTYCPGKLFVFSDDVEWCKANFSDFDRDIIYVDLPDYLTFDLMRHFDNQIIANSTFSQWAAHLNSNPDKLIIYPSLPCVDRHREHEKKKHYPKTWKLCL